MDIGRLGVWAFQLAGLQGSELNETVAELEELGYGAIWIPTFGAFEAATRILGASSKIVVATGIASIYVYDAATTVAETKRLQDAHPDRFLPGLGVSHPEAVNRDGSGRYSRPISSMGKFLDEIGPDLAQNAVLAALRTKMLTLARDRTGGAHPYFVPVEHTPRAREILGAGKLLAP